MNAYPQTQQTQAPTRDAFGNPICRDRVRRRTVKVAVFAAANAAGKKRLTRISGDFYTWLEARLEARLRELENGRHADALVDLATSGIPDTARFLTPEGRRRVLAAVRTWLRREVGRAVARHHVGKTLRPEA